MDIGWVCVDLFLNEFEETFFNRSGSYEIETLLDDVDRGTSIRCYLRDDCAEFSKEETIKRKKYLTNIQILMFFFLSYRSLEKI